MSPIKQRIAIVEHLGWQRTDPKPGGSNRPYWIEPGSPAIYFEEDLPAFDEDLNAMHEAEKVLLSTDKYDYYKWAIAKLVYPWSAHELDISMLSTEVVCATASQRAEAFLRTLNLWAES